MAGGTLTLLREGDLIKSDPLWKNLQPAEYPTALLAQHRGSEAKHGGSSPIPPSVNSRTIAMSNTALARGRTHAFHQLPGRQRLDEHTVSTSQGSRVASSDKTSAPGQHTAPRQDLRTCRHRAAIQDSDSPAPARSCRLLNRTNHRGGRVS